jgi:DNA mismatch endonuclease, patch repair protein
MRCASCSLKTSYPSEAGQTDRQRETNMDIFSKNKRSAVMSRIRSVDTKAEVRLRKALFARGHRYQKNLRKLPGTPDIVLPKHKYVIQVRGCFWHVHGCTRAHIPSTNLAYWLPKLARNVDRDKVSDAALRALGWRVRIVWECEIASAVGLTTIADKISDELHRSAQVGSIIARGRAVRCRTTAPRHDEVRQ